MDKKCLRQYIENDIPEMEKDACSNADTYFWRYTVSHIGCNNMDGSDNDGVIPGTGDVME